MHNLSPSSQLIADFVKAQKAPAAAAAAKPETVLDSAVLDGASDSGDYVDTDIALKAVAAVQEWADTLAEDLDENETLADRLFALLAGIADSNLDGEIGEDEQEVFAMAANVAYEYLSSKGVSDEDCSALLEEFDKDVAENVHELIISALPNGEEAADADIDDFVFGDGADVAAMDAAYKKRIAFRAGKKVMIKKRVSGHVRLSAKQKIGIKKMLRKSHSAKAQIRRAKSMRVRTRAGL